MSDSQNPNTPQDIPASDENKTAETPQSTRPMEPIKRRAAAPAPKPEQPEDAAPAAAKTPIKPAPTRRTVKTEQKSTAPQKAAGKPAAATAAKKKTDKPAAQKKAAKSAAAAPAKKAAKPPKKERDWGSTFKSAGLILVLLLSLFCLFISIRFLMNSMKKNGDVSQEVTTESQTSEDLSTSSDSAAAETEPSEPVAAEEPTETDPQETEEAETELVESETPASRSITISLCGDVTLGMDAQNFEYENSVNDYYDNYGPGYFFQNVKDIFEADDLTVANLECSFTEATERNGGHIYCFKAPASYSQILTEGNIDAVNLANNHTRDYLEQGLNDTRAALDDAGIPHFGYEETVVLDVKGIKVGLVGTYELIEGTGIETELKANIDKVREEGAQVVIVTFHWGDELDLVPNYNQLYLAHKAIDFGADLVNGGHAHVLQGIEEYKGKNILYGMANFCFGGNIHPHDMDSIIYQQTFTVDEEGNLVQDLVSNIIPVYTSSAYDYNNYQPTVADDDVAQRIMNKLAERTASLPAFSY